MALDELTLLVNRCRRLQENNENGENDNRIDEIRKKIADLLSKSNEKVIIKCSYEREVCMSDFSFPDFYDWIIDRLVDEHKDQEEILTDDILENFNSYVSMDDIKVIIEDKNGHELDSFPQYD